MCPRRFRYQKYRNLPRTQLRWFLIGVPVMRKKTRSLKSEWKTPYLFIAPFLISFLLFFAFPSLYSLVLSFFKYRGYGEAKFIGLNNYRTLLNYSAFWKAVRNTFFYFLGHIIPVMVGAFASALILCSKRMAKVQKIFKPLLFLPQVVPVMATALTFRVIFATNTGVINQMFHLNIPWLSDTTLMRLCVLALVIWRSTGWFMVIFLAGLTTINADLYEAATLDGATFMQQTIRITLPLMKPIFLFAFVMDAISSFKLYTEVNVMIAGTANAPTDAATIMNMITQNMENGNFGGASAAGWLLFIMIALISLLEQRLLRSED